MIESQIPVNTTLLTTCRNIIHLSFLATLILTTLVALQDIQQSQAAWWLITGIMLLPLLSFSHVVYALRTRGLIWLCFVLCLYFVMATVDYLTTTNSTLHGFLALSTILLFSSILYYVKMQTRIRKLSNATATNPDSQTRLL
jgi:uncharacterized membrane protein